jgi:hypothetical protein
MVGAGFSFSAIWAIQRILQTMAIPTKTRPTKTRTVPPASALRFSTDAPSRSRTSKPRRDIPTDHGDDDGSKPDGHRVGTESKPHHQISDTKGRSSDDETACGGRARLCGTRSPVRRTGPVWLGRLRRPGGDEESPPRYDAAEPIESARRCPASRPINGIVASKKPKMMAICTRRRPSTPERPMPMAAARFDKPRATAKGLCRT